MGQPAARIGDMTVHGGNIIKGEPTVLIGGLPAARVYDMHICPMATPGTPPIPHVGGPISKGSMGVLIGGLPAARVGDMALCTGPPDTIAPPGCPTVLIGETGAPGGGAGGGGSAAKAAGSKAKGKSGKTSGKEGKGSGDKKDAKSHYLDVKVKDKAGFPIVGASYKLTLPDGSSEKGMLTGEVKRGGIDKGSCKVEIRAIAEVKWSVAKARIGESVKLSARVEGFDPGSKADFLIYQKANNKPDVLLDTKRDVVISGKSVSTDWELTYDDSEDDDSGIESKEYSKPYYFFIVNIDGVQKRSSLLEYEDSIEIELRDHEDKPVAGEEYKLTLPTGETRTGKLDSKGYAKEEKVPPGKSSITFPNLEEFSSED